MSTFKLDQSTDYSNKELYSLLRGSDLPDYVKTAEVDDYDELQQLPKEAFADGSRKIYPLNTPARAYVSNAFFTSKKAALSKLYGKQYVSTIEKNIKEAAAIFDISEDLATYSSSFEKKASVDYGVQHLGEFELDGSEVKLYPVKTAADLLDSSIHFKNNIKNYPFSWRTKIAQNIVSLAKTMEVEELPDLVMKYAGLYYPDLEKVSQEVWRRSRKLKNAEHIEMYDKLAEDTENIGDIEEVMKLAETLFNIENMEGLYENVKIAASLGDPVDCLFTKSIDKIAEDLNFIEAHGDKYSVEDLQKVSCAKYQEAFGLALDPKDLEKLADIFPTMPRSDIKLFEEIAGVKPL